MQTIPVTIIEDEPLKVSFYKRQLNKVQKGSEYEVHCNSFANRDEWKNAVNGNIQTEVYLVDINLGKNREEEGLEIIKEVKESAPESKVFAVTAYPDTQKDVENLGAGFILKTGEPQDIRTDLAEVKKAIVSMAQRKLGHEMDSIKPDTNRTHIVPQFRKKKKPDNPTLSIVQTTFTCTGLKGDANPNLLQQMREIRMLAKHFLRSSLDLSEVIEGSYATFRSMLKGKRIEKRVEASFDWLPTEFSISREESGWISQAKFGSEELIFEKASFQNWQAEHSFPQEESQSLRHIFREQIVAHNAVFLYQNDHLSRDKTVRLVQTLSAPGQLEFMKLLYEAKLRALEAGLPRPDPKFLKEQTVQKLANFVGRWSLPMIFNLQQGEIIQIEPDKNRVLVSLDNWPVSTAPERKYFPLSRFPFLGTDGVGESFLYTPYRLGENGYGGDIELIEPSLF